jgi:ABC-type xylose transport system permease subunit
VNLHRSELRMSCPWPARGIAALALGVLIGTCWTMLNLPPSWAVTLAGTMLAVSVTIAVFRQQSCVRAQRRQAALDTFVQRELARTVPR